jgi:macrolide transport system ATP-binding/permease protein
VHRRRADLEAHAVTAPEPPLRFTAPQLPALPGATLLDAVDVTVHGRLDRAQSLSLRSRDRLVVTGPNGSGKSSLLAALAGRVEPSTGRVHRSRTARIGLLAQESPRGSRRRALDVYDAAVGRLVSTGHLTEGDVVPLGALGLLTSRDARRRVSELSVGQQRRLDLAVLLAARPHVLLLDEPTNHLSITLVDELTEAVRATAAAVVIATHDRQLLRDTASWPRLEL